MLPAWSTKFTWLIISYSLFSDAWSVDLSGNGVCLLFWKQIGPKQIWFGHFVQILLVIERCNHETLKWYCQLCGSLAMTVPPAILFAWTHSNPPSCHATAFWSMVTLLSPFKSMVRRKKLLQCVPYHNHFVMLCRMPIDFIWHKWYITISLSWQKLAASPCLRHYPAFTHSSLKSLRTLLPVTLFLVLLLHSSQLHIPPIPHSFLPLQVFISQSYSTWLIISNSHGCSVQRPKVFGQNGQTN